MRRREQSRAGGRGRVQNATWASVQRITMVVVVALCASTLSAQGSSGAQSSTSTTVSAELARMADEVARLRSLGNFDQMLEVAEAAVELAMQHATGPDDMRVASARASLGQSYLIAGRPTDAAVHYQGAVDVIVRVLGADHPSVLELKAQLARLYGSANRPADAVALYREILEVQIRTNASEALGTRLNLAAALVELNQPAEAAALLQEVAAVQVQTLGQADPATLATQDYLASVLSEMGRPLEALALWEAVLAVQTRALPQDAAAIHRTRTGVADVYLTLGREVEGVTMFENMVTAARENLGPEHPLTLAAENNLAEVYHSVGRTADAVTLYQAVLAKRERTMGAEHPDTITTQARLAGKLAALGRPSESLNLLQSALTARARALGPEHPQTLALRRVLAAAYSVMGRPADAIRETRSVLEIAVRVLGPDHPQALATQLAVARIYVDLGRPSEAIALYHAVLAAQDRTLGRDHPEALDTRAGLALAYADAGRSDEGLRECLMILAVLEQRYGPDNAATLGARTNVAVMYSLLGRRGEALEVYRSVLERQLPTLGPDHSRTLETQQSLAHVLAGEGRWSEAAEVYRQVFERRSRTLGPEHPATLRTQEDVAASHVALGQARAAEVLYRELLRSDERMVGPHHMATVRRRERLAWVVYMQGDFVAAEALWRESLRRRNEYEALLAGTMGEVGRLAVTQGARSDGGLTSAALQTGDAALRRLAASARVTRHARGSEGVGALLERARRNGQSAAVDRLVALQAEYSRRAASEVPQIQALEAVGEQLDQAWAELSGAPASGGESSNSDPLAILDAVWRALGPHEALVHLQHYRPIFPQQQGLAQEGPPRYAAFVLRGGQDPTGAPSFIDLGPATELDEGIANFHGLLMRQRNGNVLHASHGVYRRLVHPLRALLRGASTVFVVSDGATAQVPWHALVTSMNGGPGGFERYLMDEGLTVLTLSSARELVRALGPPSTGAPLVLAPFALTPERSGGLPGTEREARAVAARLTVSPRMGADAAYAALIAATRVSAPRVVHLATHGYAETDRGAASPLSFVGLRFAPGEGERARVSASRMAVELALRGTDLVVLSACESGLGQVASGQDLASTRQAFHIAGARHVLASLWPVDDAAAAFFMERFYTHLLARVSTPEAYTQALHETRDHGRGEGGRGTYSALEQWAPFSLSVVPARGRR